MLFWILLLLFSSEAISSSSVYFEAGLYKDLVWKVETLNTLTCEDTKLIIEDVIYRTSNALCHWTEGRAAFDNVVVFLPSECKDFQAAPHDVLWKKAAFLTEDAHPFAKKLPWTKQNGGCGGQGDVVLVPEIFLQSEVLTSEEKSSLMLHEWAKFRYGVYDEFGYFGDAQYRGLSALTKSMHSHDVTVRTECKSGLDSKSLEFLNELKLGLHSITSVPFLNNEYICAILSTEQFLSPWDEESGQPHNIAQNTKQNKACGRKCTSDVIKDHQDFSGGVINNCTGDVSVVNFYRLSSSSQEREKGFAFVIQRDAHTYHQGMLKIFKQATSQMLDMMSFENHKIVTLHEFGNDVCKDEPVEEKRIENEAYKRDFLKSFPESLPSPFTELSQVTDLSKAIGCVTRYLEKAHGTSSEWEIIMMVSQTPTGLSEAINAMRGKRWKLSVMTLAEESPEWLELYENFPNLNYFNPFSHCFDEELNEICSYAVFAPLMTFFSQMLNYPGSKRTIEKISSFTFNEETLTFSLEEVPSQVQEFFIMLPKMDDDTSFFVESPNGTYCETMAVLGYDLVHKVGSPICPYAEGIWTLFLNSSRQIEYSLNVFVEFESNGYWPSLEWQIGDPTMNFDPSKSSIPLSVSVSDGVTYAPILNAGLAAVIYIAERNLQLFVPKETTILLDDGVWPDLTKNDGVYSGCVEKFAQMPAYHSIEVLAVFNDSLIVSSAENDYEAALLDPRFSNKCCGSIVGIAETMSQKFPPSHRLISSFRTIEGYDPIKAPPGKIEAIKLNDSYDSLTTTFNLPRFGSEISHFDLCCKKIGTVNFNCVNIPGCTPAPGTSATSCSIRKSIIGTQTGFYSCGIRPVSKNSVKGDISIDLFEVKVPAFDGSTTAPNQNVDKCDDDCFDMWIFWLLIGIIICLLTIVMAFLLYYICSKRSSRKLSRQEQLGEKNIISPYSKRNGNTVMQLGNHQSSNPSVPHLNNSYAFDLPTQHSDISQTEVLPRHSEAEKQHVDMPIFLNKPVSPQLHSFQPKGSRDTIDIHGNILMTEIPDPARDHRENLNIAENVPTSNRKDIHTFKENFPEYATVRKAHKLSPPPRQVSPVTSRSFVVPRSTNNNHQAFQASGSPLVISIPGLSDPSSDASSIYLKKNAPSAAGFRVGTFNQIKHKRVPPTPPKRIDSIPTSDSEIESNNNVSGPNKILPKYTKKLPMAKETNKFWVSPYSTTHINSIGNQQESGQFSNSPKPVIASSLKNVNDPDNSIPLLIVPNSNRKNQTQRMDLFLSSDTEIYSDIGAHNIEQPPPLPRSLPPQTIRTSQEQMARVPGTHNPPLNAEERPTYTEKQLHVIPRNRFNLRRVPPIGSQRITDTQWDNTIDDDSETWDDACDDEEDNYYNSHA